MANPVNFKEFMIKNRELLPNYYFMPQFVDDLRLMYLGIPLPITNDSQVLYPHLINDEVFVNDRARFFINFPSILEFNKNIDFNYGTRIHGAVGSILSGVPSFVFPTDARIRELAEYHNVPNMPASEVDENTDIFDIYENNAYDIQQELKKKYPKLRLEVLIGSVRNTKRIESVMDLYRPDVVYHAAAHKHVPLMEDSPNEAIKNNVFGTYKTARAADKYGVKKFVLISTDKAVNPTNIMGASKRLCEMIIQKFSRYSKTEFVAVRFGNVLGSNGSVIPLFKKQMAAGGPVTVTHPDSIRFFMTIPEAVSLVMQAGALAHGGEIFVLDMGEPVKIADLAKNLIRLSGYTLGVDMNIEYTGLRPGEKLYEEILTKEEGLQKTANNLIYVGQPLEFDEVHFLSELKKLEIAASEESRDVKKIVSGIVSTYHIREEDKERDEEMYEELLSLGKASHEEPVVEDR